MLSFRHKELSGLSHLIQFLSQLLQHSEQRTLQLTTPGSPRV